MFALRVRHEFSPSTRDWLEGLIARRLQALETAVLERIQTAMSALSDATDKILAAAEAEKTKDDAILAYVQGIPDVIKAAVADALESSGGDAQAMADKLNAAADTIGGDPDRVLTAITANTTPPADSGSGDTTQAAGGGDDSINGGEGGDQVT